MPWDDASSGVTNISAWQPPIALDDAWVRVNADAHYEKDGQRLRILGVNITGRSAFPSMQDGDAHAKRLARFGYNGVRFHHMEAPWEKANVLIDYASGSSRELSAARLDRLHAFVAALANNGVYTNINLLVSREFQAGDGLGPEISRMEWKDQHVLGFFHPVAFDLHKEFARKLLTAPNPYRGGRPMAQDPAVAFVEIMNENGFLQNWYGGVLDGMPATYRRTLESRWNQWLKSRYADSAAMKQAWGVIDLPLGPSLLRNGDFAAGPSAWVVERHSGAVASVSTPLEFDGGRPALRVEVNAPGSANWHVQINQAALRLESGKVYTVSFWARSAQGGVPLSAQMSRAYGDYGNISGGPSVRLTTDWREYTWVFQSGVDETNARLNFNGFGNLGGAVAMLANVRVQEGGKVGTLPEGRSLENGNVPPVPRVSSTLTPTGAQLRDWIRYLLAAEADYWAGMRQYVKEELGYPGIVFATIISNSPPNTQASQDAIDSHTYWSHPDFPGTQWSAVDWVVNNVSMLTSDSGGTLGLARQRVKGKPHNVTEYQHSHPNTYSSESPLLSAAYGAFQDWDSIWFFEYATGRNEHVTGFFDQSGHAGKLANNLIAAAMFRRGDVQPGREEMTFALTPEREVEIAATRGGAWSIADGSHLGVPAAAALTNRLSLAIGDGAEGRNPALPVPADRLYRSDTGELTWDSRASGRGIVTVTAPRSKLLAGFVALDRLYELGDGVVVSIGATRQQWATFGLSFMEGSLGEGGRALAVVTGDQENTGMVWKDPARRNSVGDRWGGPPVRIEAVPAKLQLPVAASRVKAWRLDGRGQRGEAISVNALAEGRSELSIAGLWCEIEIAPQ